MKERRQRNPETLRLKRFQPGFTVNNLDESVRFYTETLGFVVGQRWEEKGVLQGVTLKAGTSELFLSQDDWSKGRDRRKGEGVRIWCETAQDVDGLATRIKASGKPLTEEPEDQPWGVRSFGFDDPDGYHLTFYKAK